MPRATLTELLDQKIEKKKYTYKTPEMQQKSMESLVKGRTTVIERKNARKAIDKNIADQMGLKKVPVDGVNIEFDLKKLEAYEAANILTARNKQQLKAIRNRESITVVNNANSPNLRGESEQQVDKTASNAKDKGNLDGSEFQLSDQLNKMTSHILELQAELKGHTAKYEKSLLETQEYRQKIAKEKEERRQYKLNFLEKSLIKKEEEKQKEEAAALQQKEEAAALQQKKEKIEAEPKKYVRVNPTMRYNATPLFSF